jgi:hypothetical protein
VSEQDPGQPDQELPSNNDDVMSRRRALGAGIGLAIVIATYGPSGLGDAGRWWAAGATIVVAVLLVDLIADLCRLMPIPGTASLTIVAALLAIYLCVPETDQIPVAAFVPVALVGMELVSRRQMGLEWYAVAAASVGWAGLLGATGRQSALVGAIFAWWAVALVPLVHMVRPLPSKAAGLLVAAIGAVSVVVMARTGGIAETAEAAWLAAALIAAASFGIALILVSSIRHDASTTKPQ